MSFKNFNEKTATLGILKGLVGESMVKYFLKIAEKISILKRASFHKNTRK